MYNLYNPFIYRVSIPEIDLEPPTIYSILESIVNYGTDDKKKIKDLAKYGRTEIFDFDYDLTDKLTKEDFECQILNHYLMRRIGYETVTAFKIQLNVKINELMPIFNKMIDSIDNWDLFTGEEITRTGSDNTITQSDSFNETNSSNDSLTRGKNISDRRFSDTPQDHLEEIRNGEYVTSYSYDTDDSESTDVSSGKANSKTNASSNDNKKYEEKIIHTVSDKIGILKEIQFELNNIYKIIYNSLDDLFYGLV